MSLREILKDICLFLLLYAAAVVGCVMAYTFFNFGIVSLSAFMGVVDEVFTLDWAVKKIKLYSVILLFVVFWAMFFLKTKHIIILSALLFLLPIFEFDIISYLRYKNTTTTFYEENYVAPKIEKAQKNNLIVVYLESFEKQFASDEVSPVLAQLKKENISFDGFIQASAAHSTIHAQFASLCGLPLLQDSLTSGDEYMNFLPKIKCIPNLLKENGYSTAYLKAADIKFSRANYFAEQHNFDMAKGWLEFEKKAKEITDDYLGNEFGGIKDRVLFEVAKDEINSLKEPFFVTLTTLDMHRTPEFYYDPKCEKKFYDVRDVAACTGLSVKKFVDWVKKQPFGKRTTILLMGDHRISKGFFSAEETLNIFLNSVIPANNQKRKFTTYDFAPTILEAIGYDIGKFGIGRSLFRDDETLMEQKGNDFNLLVSANNKLYNEFKKFDNINASYKNYKIGQKLNNKTLDAYVDFGEKSPWCKGAAFISMTLDKHPKNDLYIKMDYLKVNDPFKIFVNDVVVYKNDVTDSVAIKNEKAVYKIPLSAFNDKNKIAIKINSPNNSVNRVLTLCIREFSIEENR